MEKQYSSAWNSSTQPRKQRKYRHNLPYHRRHSVLSAHLSAELRKQHKKRAATVRKNDVVKIMKGDYKGKTGKITSVNTKKLTAYIDGAERSRRDGTKAFIPINVSNLMIIEFSLEDNRRLKKNG